jgi:hypothetical protein
MMRSLVLCSLILAAGCAHPGAGPTATAPAAERWLEIIGDTSRVTCYGSGGDDRFGSRLARSAPMTASSGRVAWAEVEALATEWPDRDARLCQNVSTVLVRSPEWGEQPRAVFRQDPGAEGESGNSVRLVSWSADGEKLLFELRTWIYPTDVPELTVVTWNATTQALLHAPAANLVRAHFPTPCDLELEAIGFSGNGDVLVRSSPPAGSENPCSPAVRLWRIVRAETTLTAVPADGEAPQLGRTD